MKKGYKYQKNLVKHLRNGDIAYTDAPLYTVLLDLVIDNGTEEVATVLKWVTIDFLLQSQRERRKEMNKLNTK
jgi:hypothetical protein